MSLVCFLDLDGVLVDFVGGSFDFHKKSVPMKDVRWDFPQQIGFSGTWCNEFWNPLGREFWANLGWTKEGKDLLSLCEQLFGKENIVLLTSPCNTEGCVEGKLDWIKRELPDYKRQYFIGPPKHLMASPDKILLDDHEGNTDKFDQAGGRTVLIPRPWNKRIESTDEEGNFDVRLISEELWEIKRAKGHHLPNV